MVEAVGGSVCSSWGWWLQRWVVVVAVIVVVVVVVSGSGFDGWW